jgi:hypothetical protein
MVSRHCLMSDSIAGNARGICEGLPLGRTDSNKFDCLLQMPCCTMAAFDSQIYAPGVVSKEDGLGVLKKRKSSVCEALRAAFDTTKKAWRCWGIRIPSADNRS